MFSLILPALLLGASQIAFAQQTHMHDNHRAPDGSEIGDVQFNVNCSENVQDEFDYALGMLHHMMYVNARELFEEITVTESDCAMAYWGIATTLFQPLWGTRPSEEDLQVGWENISKAQELANSEREELLIESTASFFREPESADFRTRIDRWTDAMEDVYEAYPNDHDIAALYSLTRLTKAQFADDRSQFHDEAETVLRDIYEQNNSHPGAIHYSIHATDVDGRAGNALEMVEAYSEIAPEVPHALHMPSHIYVRLGDWPKVIDWNIQSSEAALNHPVNDAESHHYVHAIDYLVYAYLQQGEDEKAETAYGEALTREKHQASFVSAFHFAAIPARLAIEQRDWEKAISLEPRTPEYLPWDESPWAEGITWYARGLGGVHTGDIETAKQAEQQLKNLRESAKERGDESMAAYIETDRFVLAGWIAHNQGDEEKALELIRSAAELEESVEKHPVTPGALQPPYEALGDLLIELNRPAEALEAYEKSDEIWPGRLNTLMGAATAAKMSGDDRIARAHFAKLIKNAGNGELESMGAVEEID